MYPFRDLDPDQPSAEWCLRPSPIPIWTKGLIKNAALLYSKQQKELEESVAQYVSFHFKIEIRDKGIKTS